MKNTSKPLKIVHKNHIGENVPLVMLILKNGTKLIKMSSRKHYKYITSIRRLKVEMKYIKMVKSDRLESRIMVSFYSLCISEF